MKTIAVIDDDIHIGNFLEELLRQEGYEVLRAYSGTEAVLLLERHRPDLVLLDLMMPGLSGEEVLGRISGVPVVVLSAKAGVEDKVKLLLDGAVDYVTKPFDSREFVARVRALTRRGGTYTPSVISAGNVTLDRSSFELRCGDACIRLGNKEFQMLELLMQQKGRPISTEQFMESIWGYDSEAEINVVWAYISYLRRKLESAGANIRISARRGQGYVLEEVS